MPFLDRTIEKNPRLVETGGRRPQEGKIPANTWLLDLDVITSNAALIKSEAARVGLRLYFMTKQYGRNPVVTKAVLGDSDAKTASVDIQCAKALHYNGLPLGNIGNLSQLPESDLPVVVGQMQPEVITVFSIEKAASVSRAAVDAGRSQDLLIR